MQHSYQDQITHFFLPEFLDDDISDDVACVKEIYDETEGLRGNGFLAW